MASQVVHNVSLMDTSKRTTQGRPPNIELVSIGSELLLGQIVDTNSAWISQRLAEAGGNIYYKTTVGDNMRRMVEVLSQAVERADVVITGGGIGPTKDDLTREAVAEVFGVDIVTHEPSLKDLRDRYQKRGFIITKNNERQAQIPEGAVVVKNPNGTAPAFIVEGQLGTLIALPGVPFEMEWLMTNEVIPYLRRRFNLSETIHYRVLKVIDMGESAVDDKIGHLIAESENPTVGVLARPGQVDVRVASRAPSMNDALKMIEPMEQRIREVLGHNVFGVDDETIESVVGAMLESRQASVAVYEDLSGGAVAEVMRTTAGDGFVEAHVANTEEARLRLLDRTAKDATGIGMEHAVALARTMRARSGATYGVAVHGVAGSSTETLNLAEGDTYVVVDDGETTATRHVRTAGSKAPDRRRAAMQALGLLRSRLLGHA